ncbi:MAG: type II toxin-antitoxin system HicB family antitoxin [bacterium]
MRNLKPSRPRPDSRHVVLLRTPNGRWLAQVPSLPGCTAEGESRDDAMDGITQAIRRVAGMHRRLKEPLPPDQPAEIAVVATDLTRA